MAVTLTDVSASLKGLPLTANGGKLTPTNSNMTTVASFAVANWQLTGGNFPVPEILVSGTLFIDKTSGSPWLVTITFMDPGGQWALGPTYRVDFSDGQYGPHHERDLTAELRRALVT